MLSRMAAAPPAGRVTAPLDKRGAAPLRLPLSRQDKLRLDLCWDRGEGQG